VLKELTELTENKLLVITDSSLSDNFKKIIKELEIENKLSYFPDMNLPVTPDYRLASDYHPNEYGYKYIADKTFKYLTNKNLINCP